MKVINLAETNSAVSNYVAQLRDITAQGNRYLFRSNLKKIGMLMAYEISKTLDYSPKTILTPLAECTVSTCSDRIVVGTVLRAGLALHEGFMQIFDEADAGFVAAFRKEDGENITIQLDYLASPSLDGKTFMLVDPMLATGKSFEAAYKAYLTHGMPAKLHIVAVVASEQGVAYLQKLFPSDEVTLWCAVIDPELNSLSYIVPGLGDCGDLCYGEKL
ncbi:MAG: uracil phosphoribosyltransferase [Bacteroidaceae bacterium]|nr:uracil phosphoribosyltransferase [Bacteroidaceae bacterium]